MAVFLLKALEGEGYTPPACVTEVFTDVPCASPFAPWINELARSRSHRGLRRRDDVLSGGCDEPAADGGVPAEERRRAPRYVPPACMTPAFDDVPCTNPFAPWINELVARGVTAGCGGANYCPAGAVARQQMAVFLVKTFGLVLYGP